MEIFNQDHIRSADIRVAPSGFRYGFIADVFHEDVYQELIRTFPDVGMFKLVDKISGGGRKRFYVAPHYEVSKHMGCWCHLRFYSPLWQRVFQESASPTFISFLSTALGVPCNSMCVFGHTYGNEGCRQDVHIDGAVRDDDYGKHKSTLATLLYFNERPDNISGTCIYAPDKKTVLFQAPSMRNGMFFFEQHPQAWHGFPLMPASAERRLVSLAYGQEHTPIKLNSSLLHMFTCKNFWKTTLSSLR